VSFALRESSAKLGRSELERESVHHSVEGACVKENGAGHTETSRNRERILCMDMAKNRANNNVSVRSGKAIPDDSSRQLKTIQPSDTTVEKMAEAASDKNQVMDELLNQDQIPADYGAKMVELFHDEAQDELTRDFAVQHIGLYAQALQRRGAYDPASAEARTLRTALDEASADAKSIIAAAAFRALADMAAFAPHVDARRLDARLAVCVGDASASPAARVMAAHLCGERRVAAARAPLSSLVEAPSTPTPLRLAVRHALKLLAQEIVQ